jgi:hypothetical protein
MMQVMLFVILIFQLMKQHPLGQALFAHAVATGKFENPCC